MTLVLNRRANLTGMVYLTAWRFPVGQYTVSALLATVVCNAMRMFVVRVHAPGDTILLRFASFAVYDNDALSHYSCCLFRITTRKSGV